MHTVQKRTWEENDKFIFHNIIDEINGNLFLLEEAESIRRMPRDNSELAVSIRRMPRDRRKLSQSIRVCARIAL